MTTVELPKQSRLIRNLQKLDRFVEPSSDFLNPILIKEARQALKSRQFIVTFMLLLLAAWAWTATAILVSMPRIYYVPSGDYFLMGYYLVLAVPMLLVVPLAAHRSLASEMDDGTLDLLSVTNLSPMQIISGKLASAALQMMLYFVALLPCVAFCYVLRGVDLPSIIALIGLTVSVGVLLTVVGLFLAALPKARSGQLGMLVAMLIIVVLCEFGFGSFALAVINGEVFTEIDGNFFALTVIAIIVTATAAVVLLRAAAAELSPPSENRSTPIRKALLAHHISVLALLFFALLTEGRNDRAVVLLAYYQGIFWLSVGGLMVGESEVLTPRVRRDLPATFFERMFASWFTPGPATGLVFAVLAYATFAVAALGIRSYAPTAANSFMLAVDPVPHVFVIAGYLMLILTLTRFGMKLVRLRANPHPSVGLAVMVIVSGSIALAPYAIQLWWNEYRNIDWSYWQITNWVWTLGTMFESATPTSAPFVVFILGLVPFLVSIITMGSRVLPLRVATPERVLDEVRPAAPDWQQEGVEVDPFAN